jgi:hypothetical protein
MTQQVGDYESAFVASYEPLAIRAECDHWVLGYTILHHEFR